MKSFWMTGLLLAGAVQAAEPATYTVELLIRNGTELASPRVQVRDGQSFRIAVGEGDGKVSAEFTVASQGAGSVKLTGAVRCADGAAATPTLIARLGDAAKVAVTGPADTRCELSMTVREESQPATAQ